MNQEDLKKSYEQFIRAWIPVPFTDILIQCSHGLIGFIHTHTFNGFTRWIR